MQHERILLTLQIQNMGHIHPDFMEMGMVNVFHHNSRGTTRCNKITELDKRIPLRYQTTEHIQRPQPASIHHMKIFQYLYRIQLARAFRDDRAFSRSWSIHKTVSLNRMLNFRSVSRSRRFRDAAWSLEQTGTTKK